MEFMIFKLPNLDSRFQRKNLVLKICTESQDIGQSVSNFAGLVWKADFGQFFGNILLHIFQKKILHLNSEFEPLNLNNESHNPNNCFHLQRGQSHFLGHFLIGKWPQFEFLSPDPCLV